MIKKLTEKNVERLVVEVTPSLYKAISQAISKDSHSTRSEFVRDAVRRRLEEMGYNPQVFPQKKVKNTPKIEKEIEA